MGHRMSVNVDEKLIQQVCEVLDVTSRSEAIRIALAELLRRKKLEKALGHRGSIDLDLDQQSLRDKRQQT